MVKQTTAHDISDTPNTTLTEAGILARYFFFFFEIAYGEGNVVRRICHVIMNAATLTENDARTTVSA